MKFSVNLNGISRLNTDIELGDINIITGPNGSGKTLLIKVIYAVMKALTKPSPEALHRGGAEIEKTVEQYVEDELLRILGTKPTGVIELIGEDGDRITISAARDRIAVDLSRVGNIISELYTKFFPAVLAPIERARVLRTEQPAYDDLTELSELMKNLKSEARIYGKFDIKSDELGLGVTVYGNGFTATIGGAEVDVDKLPYGYAQLIPILLLPRSYKFIIIDEPALNLDPRMQHHLAAYLYRLVDEGRRILVTTHSDALIAELVSNYAKRGKTKGKSIKIYLLDDGKATTI